MIYPESSLRAANMRDFAALIRRRLPRMKECTVTIKDDNLCIVIDVLNKKGDVVARHDLGAASDLDDGYAVEDAIRLTEALDILGINVVMV